ncbi:MAG: FHA domain-containing protein [Chloroflexota bacterium]
MLRLFSAALLLAFLGAIAWSIYQDLRVTARAVARQAQVQGYLLVVASDVDVPPVGTRLPLLPVTSIGRSPRNTVVLNNEYASGEHALLTWRGSQWWLEDLGSRNGTLLNEMALAETAVVSPGDIISIGGTQFKLEL